MNARDLHMEKLNPASAIAKRTEVEDTYRTSFPEEERIPFETLLVAGERADADFLSFYDKGVFCGFAFVFFEATDAYILFLAVNPFVRSRGYGTAILDRIKTEYAGRTLMLDIETVGADAENEAQRLARRCFYLRNGFTDTGFRSKDASGIYDVLSTSDTFDPERLEAFYALIPEGSPLPQVYRARD